VVAALPSARAGAGTGSSAKLNARRTGSGDHAQCWKRAMFNPLKWEYVDQVRLLFAAAFGALLGFANGYSYGWFNLLWALIGAVVVSGAFYCLRVFRR
jgi:hypothetical protein